MFLFIGGTLYLQQLNKVLSQLHVHSRQDFEKQTLALSAVPILSIILGHVLALLMQKILPFILVKVQNRHPNVYTRLFC